MFNVIVGVIMGVAFIGMIVCAKKQNAISAAKPAALGLLVVVIICAIMLLSGGKSADEDVITAEVQYAASTTYTLGKHLSHTMPGAKVLVVTSTIRKDNEFQQAKIKALKEGLSPATTDVVFEALAGNNHEGVTAADMNKLFAKHKDCDLIITLIGLPFDMEKMKIWNQFLKDKKKTPKLAIISEDIFALGAFIQSGLIVGAVVLNPKYRPIENPPVPANYDEAFKKRYLLITPKNVAAMSKKYPKLFPKQRRRRR